MAYAIRRTFNNAILFSVQPNGLKVLERIPGLVESLGGQTIDRLYSYSTLPEDSGLLGEIDAAKRRKDGETAFGPRGIRRKELQRAILQGAEKAGVEIKWGHKLVGLEQAQDSVTVKFENGVEDTASFVVGSDGLHSNTRICLFGQEQANYTGLVQVCFYHYSGARLSIPVLT